MAGVGGVSYRGKMTVSNFEKLNKELKILFHFREVKNSHEPYQLSIAITVVIIMAK